MVFLKIEGLRQPCINQVSWHHFSNNICSLCVSLSHVGHSCSISNFFTVVIFGTVVCDQGSLMLLLWLFWDTRAWAHVAGEPNPQMCVFWLPHWAALPASHPLLRPLYSLRHSNIEIRPVNNPTATSKCSSERKGRTSLTLEMLEMM